jgi:hypothetical protein
LGVRVPAGAGNFACHHSVQTGIVSPPQSPIQWVQGALSLGVERLGREADHPFPSSAEAKNVSPFPNTPLWCDAQLKRKHRDNFTFTFIGLTVTVWEDMEWVHQWLRF